jgi:hypothetical protein
VGLKIGFLLDSLVVSRWQEAIITCVQHHPQLSVVLVVVNAAPVKRKPAGREVYKFFMRLDRRIFTVKHDAFELVAGEHLLSGVETLQVATTRKKHVTVVADADVALIRSKGVDVLIRFGFGIVKGEILKAARFGIWSLHHGDTAVNRGGPPGFWEVVNREAVTGVTLQQLTEQLDGGVVLGKAFTRTDFTSFNRNQNAVYWSGVELFCHALNRVSQEGDINGLMSEHEQGVPCSRPLYRDPGNPQALKIFARFWWRRLNESLQGSLHPKQWTIYYGGAYPRDASVLRKFKKLNPPRGYDWADPFVVFFDDRYYVFFEELKIKTRKAHISCLVFDKNGRAISKKPQKVLEENHHVSYPFVFQWGGEWYMVPESAAAGEVVLYRCEKFPDKWVRHTVLLRHVNLFDPTLHYHEGTWYLLGTQRPWPGNSADQYLYIYFSESLEGVWKAHPQNPVKRDVRGARPAGRIFAQEGKRIRPSQIGAPRYGYGIRLQEILKLTPTEFEERPLHDILPDCDTTGKATHTLNFADGFYVVDGQR